MNSERYKKIVISLGTIERFLRTTAFNLFMFFLGICLGLFISAKSIQDDIQKDGCELSREAYVKMENLIQNMNEVKGLVGKKIIQEELEETNGKVESPTK